MGICVFIYPSPYPFFNSVSVSSKLKCMSPDLVIRSRSLPPCLQTKKAISSQPTLILCILLYLVVVSPMSGLGIREHFHTSPKIQVKNLQKVEFAKMVDKKVEFWNIFLAFVGAFRNCTWKFNLLGYYSKDWWVYMLKSDFSWGFQSINWEEEL